MEASMKKNILEHWQQFRGEVEAAGEELRSLPMPVLTDELFSLYESTGDRLAYENIYFERRRFLAVFGLLSIWYGRTKDLEKLAEVLANICLEKTWALPAHVNLMETDWQRTVDLFACETGQSLAQIITLLKGKLPDKLTTQVKSLVIDRLLDSYMEKEPGKWRWEHFYNNWVAVCAGCLGCMAIDLLGDEPVRQHKIIDRVCLTLPDYLQGFCEDGTCPEGLSYFTYGMSYFIGFSRKLSEFTKGKINLMDTEKVRRAAVFQQCCYLPGGATVSFSDGNRQDRYRLGLTCYLAMQVPGVKIPDISSAMYFNDDHCYRFLSNYQDDCWVQEYLAQNQEEAIQKKQWFTLLPDAQWAVWQWKNIGIALKGGNNAEPHNHNDVGSFLYTADGEFFLTDLGCGEYTRDYFADQTRYKLLCNRSLGHNVPLPAGQEQGIGADFHAGSFTSSKEGRVHLEFGEAYPLGAVKNLERTLSFTPDTDILYLTDLADANNEETSFIENFVTQTDIRLQEHTIYLIGQKGTLALHIEEGFGKISLQEEVFSNHRGQLEKVTLIQWKVPQQNHQYKCSIRCCYTPDRPSS